MLRLTFDRGERPVQTVLCLGAHADDIEIGCGGTILKLSAEHAGLRIYWIVLSADGPRAAEARRSAELFLHGTAERNVSIQQFPESYFPYEGRRIKDYFESIKNLSPDVIFTHCRQDQHQDHRLVSELTWNTFRDHLILEYEIPKYDGDLGQTNAYVGLDEVFCKRKIQYILECFESQRSRHWFTEDTFLAILRLRGIEAGGGTQFAEGFYGRKMVF
jgi:LmbE family N-acetylglucosaminyl deacetylase